MLQQVGLYYLAGVRFDGKETQNLDGDPGLLSASPVLDRQGMIVIILYDDDFIGKHSVLRWIIVHKLE